MIQFNTTTTANQSNIKKMAKRVNFSGIVLKFAVVAAETVSLNIFLVLKDCVRSCIVTELSGLTEMLGF